MIRGSEPLVEKEEESTESSMVPRCFPVFYVGREPDKHLQCRDMENPVEQRKVRFGQII